MKLFQLGLHKFNERYGVIGWFVLLEFAHGLHDLIILLVKDLDLDLQIDELFGHLGTLLGQPGLLRQVRGQLGVELADLDAMVHLDLVDLVLEGLQRSCCPNWPLLPHVFVQLPLQVLESGNSSVIHGCNGLLGLGEPIMDKGP